MTDLWSPSTDYALGALVLPRASANVVSDALTNASFESGDSGWAKGAGWTIINGGGYDGVWKGHFTGAGPELLKNNNIVPVVPGQSITGTAAVECSTDGSRARIGIAWYDASNALIDTAWADLQTGGGLHYKRQSVTGVAPPLATTAQLVVEGDTDSGILDLVRVDACGWNYAYVEVPPALTYEATAAGLSSTAEPTWPTSAGGTVVDGGVTWTARAAVSITWEAKPILKSGATEPTWPTAPGDLVADGTISWQTTSRRIEDARCPNTSAVVKAASKMWATAGDIVRFCAVNNAKDWTSANDAGYIPTGLHQDGNNATSVLGAYRGNLAPMSASTFQLWAVDEDPAGNALLDKMEGIGSIYHHASCAVGDDFYFLSAIGVRSVGIAVGSSNLRAGDIGMPVDTLIQAKAAEALAAGITIRAWHNPGAGQYWICFGDEVYVYTMTQVGQVGAWSRYVFPFEIEARAQLGNDLYVRDGLYVRKITDTVNYDEMVVEGATVPVYFDGIIQWPWLDCGSPGMDKEMIGFDVVCDGDPTIQFGYDQRNTGTFTDAYTVGGDTLTGDMIAMPLTAPSISVKVTFQGAEDNFWQLQAFNLYFQR